MEQMYLKKERNSHKNPMELELLISFKHGSIEGARDWLNLMTSHTLEVRAETQI